MSDPVEIDSCTVDIDQWIEKAKADPGAYLERQVTEIFLAALGMTTPFAHEIFLKGGILMGVVYASPRQTGDVDFTAISEPTSDTVDALKTALGEALPRAAARLGYPDILCAVQSSRFMPSERMFAKARGPALSLRIGYARRGAAQEAKFRAGRSPTILDVDISFREPVNAIQLVRLGDSGVSFRAYSLIDLIAEKLRALLQQEARNRNRRQDIYDIASLLACFTLDDEEKQTLLDTLCEKSRARAIEPDSEALSRTEIMERARKEWDTLAIEIGELPDFDECFATVDGFYRSLPWSAD